jgi:hypothetical protein
MRLCYARLPSMGVSFMVRGRTERECQQALDELCERLGARPTLLPSARFGHGWVARAERKTALDHDDPGLAVR